MFELVIRFLALLTTGLAAGGALCIVFLDRMLGSSGAFYTEYKQLSVRALTLPLPALGIVGTVCAAVFAYYLAQRDATLSFRLTLGAVLLGVAAGVITRAGHFPINDQIMTWSPDAPPATWMATQARWSALHLARTAVSTCGFALLLLANLIGARI